MAVVMELKQWLKLTDGGITKPRSKELKAVDDALRAYHVSQNSAAMSMLQGALIKWMQKEGGNWKKSIRNKHNAVDTLYKQVTGTGNVAKTGAGMLAISYARDESRAIVTDLFAHKELRFRSGLMTKLAGNSATAKVMTGYSIGSLVRNTNKVSHGAVANAANQVRQAPGALAHAVGIGGHGGAGASHVTLKAAAERILAEITPPELLSEVKAGLEYVMPDFITHFAASLTPYLGIITSGGTTLYSGYKVLKAQWRVYDAGEHAQRTLSTGEPEKAIEALVRMLERERNNALAKCTVGLVEFGGKMAGMLADGGTTTTAAIGLASGVVKLTMLIRIVIRDVSEKRAANRLMALGTVNASLFQACPLMGAYLILCAPTSVLVNTIFDDGSFYEPGMMDKVERAVTRHINPLREQALRMVKEHRMYIPELQDFPGMVKKNKEKLEEMKERMGKTEIGKQHLSWEDYR
ncbi:MAG TPA: hypothetical protein VG603_10945 [Chitinophagales bacterium]|nr:hypothetical protein [Chitinophagales bacterium]